MRVLVLGATGLLGNVVFRVLSQAESIDVWGTTRSSAAQALFSPTLARKLITVNDLLDGSQLASLLDSVTPDVVVNCTAHSRADLSNTSQMVAILSLMPQRLRHLSRQRNVRLIQIGSDGVFTGKRGNYTEDDYPDADDTYGVAKILGEVSGPGAVTLRTSIIGPELGSGHGLLSWFLSQQTSCRCYRRAIFSGLPTVTLAQIIRDLVLPNSDLEGVYHVASQPISKFDVLAIVRRQYGKQIELIPDDSVLIDRSLNAGRFCRATGYTAPPWQEMIAAMHAFKFGLRDS